MRKASTKQAFMKKIYIIKLIAFILFNSKSNEEIFCMNYEKKILY